MWRKYFRFRLVPGVMIHPRFGKIDFRRDDLDVEMLRQIVEGGSYYLELTPDGQKELYGVEVQDQVREGEITVKSRKRRHVS